MVDLLIDDRANIGGEPGKYDRVDIELRDRGALRALDLLNGIRATTVSVRLREDTAALSLVARPEWPTLLSLRSGYEAGVGSFTELVFATRAPVNAVVAELGRQSVWPDRVGQRGLVVHRFGGLDRDKVPADVLVADWHMSWGDDGEPPVTGRHPYVVTAPDGELAIGSLDERVLNPIGFDTAPNQGLGTLSSLRGVADGATAEMVRQLRPLRGLELDFDREELDLPTARLIAGLAMAGVPLTCWRLPPSYVHVLGTRLCRAIIEVVDLEDPLAREEHSVLLRRAALAEFSSYAWRRRVGELAGVRVHHQPSVSVVMATRRPTILRQALMSITRQRGVESLELVLAPHGFDADPAVVAEAMGAVPHTIVPATEDTLFGDALNAAANAATGDVVLKMDDDDWYSPDFVADLLHARAYSGAELVGTPDDLYYLEERDLTLRLGQPAEVYRQFVAGGTMLLDRVLLREVGGFRSVRRHVDAQLIAAVRDAGGATYRAHGLGYCLLRTSSGHTWDTDLDELVGRAVQTWQGFKPGRLMEL